MQPTYATVPANAGFFLHAAIFDLAATDASIHTASAVHFQVSYMILQRVSPVTHSVGNCVKRVVVIVASVIFFRNPMSTQNALGKRSLSAGHL
jgi:hypothetical protein